MIIAVLNREHSADNDNLQFILHLRNILKLQDLGFSQWWRSKIQVFFDVTPSRLVINYRRFEHSHVVHEQRLGLLGPEQEGNAMFRKEETICKPTQGHIPEDVYSTATSVQRTVGIQMLPE
jgi:hypothetical protein